MRDFLRWLVWWRHPAMLRTVIVNLVDDDSVAYRGVLWRARGPWLILKQATALRIQGEAAPIDGDVIIERGRVQFLQVL